MEKISTLEEIKTWEELSTLKNDKYHIVVNKKYYGGWIIPNCDIEDDTDDFICNCPKDIQNNHFFEHHVYLSTHTFYGSNYEYSTKILQKYGFNVILENWDKGRK